MKKIGEFQVVNHPVPREDGVPKVTGRALFTSDIYLEGMAHAKVLHSPLAHARIMSVNISEAMTVPGVNAVFSGQDLKGIDPYYGHAVKDHPLLAIGKVRFVGEPVVVAVAETELSAAEALEKVDVEYDELPAVMDCDQALAAGAALIHEKSYLEGPFKGFDDHKAGGSPNMCQHVQFEWGNVDEAFDRAEHVVEGEYYFPMAYAFAMEPYGAVAKFDDEGLTVYSTAQHPFMVRHDLAKIFGLPLNRVRLVVPFVGGGYGSKSYTKVEPLTAACAWKTGRPVKLQLSVEEAMQTIRGDDARVRIRTAADAEGNITARQALIHLNTGAYAENSPLVCKKAANRIVGPYKIPNVRVEALAVYTNTVPASSYRGFGAAQVTFSAESQIDQLAEKVGFDRVQFRLKNLASRGESIHPGLRPLDADLRGDLNRVSVALGMDSPLRKGHGLGVGLSASDAGAFPVSTAMIQVYGDNSVSVHIGTTEMGQGSRGTFRMIAAEELGVELDKVRVINSDTAITPFDRSTGASRSTTLMGRALIGACQDAIAQMKVMAAEVLRACPEELVQVGQGLRYKEKTFTWGEILEKFFDIADCSIIGRGYVRKAGDLSQVPPFWEIGCCGIEISVDEETGCISIKHLVTLGDVGLAINPAAAEAQDLGAATMGLGIALSEELVYEGQQLLNASMIDYRVPRFQDLSSKIDLLLAQNQDGTGPYGAKGSGEGALNPMTACVANALYEATGVRSYRVPLTPERVWRALREKKVQTAKAHK